MRGGVCITRRQLSRGIDAGSSTWRALSTFPYRTGMALLQTLQIQSLPTLEYPKSSWTMNMYIPTGPLARIRSNLRLLIKGGPKMGLRNTFNVIQS